MAEMIVAGALMDALFFKQNGAMRDNTTGPLPALPVPVNYPSSGAITLLDLVGPDYTPTVRQKLIAATCMASLICAVWSLSFQDSHYLA